MSQATGGLARSFERGELFPVQARVRCRRCRYHPAVHMQTALVCLQWAMTSSEFPMAVPRTRWRC
eukprot:7563250-Alexandrium_andersonii.AAC.1